MMGIIFPIIVNLVLVSVFVSSILIGKKLGWKASLVNLFITVGSLIGGYYLSKIDFFTNIHATYLSILSDLMFKVTFASLFATIVYVIEVIISVIIYRKKNLIKAEVLNTAKIKRAKAIDKKVEKLIKKQERQAEKVNRVYRKLTTKSRVFGALICVLTGLLLTCTSYVGIKAICIYAQDKTQVEWLDEGYIYTLPGQLDKVIK